MTRAWEAWLSKVFYFMSIPNNQDNKKERLWRGVCVISYTLRRVDYGSAVQCNVQVRPTIAIRYWPKGTAVVGRGS